MHIPDGFLDVKTWGTLYVISAGAVAVGTYQANKKLGEKNIPIMGITSAFIFAAQMLNFPVAGGTSGHFMGAALASILLGPFSGMIILTAVLVVQCLVFQDGGLTALGANVFNMGIIGSFLSYFIYFLTAKMFKMTVAAFLSGWLSIVFAASACAFELGVSGTFPLKMTLPAMASVHAIIGIGEGIITVLVLESIRKIRPDLLELEKV